MAQIELKSGQVVRVDDDDIAALSVHSWHLTGRSGQYYAAADIDGKQVKMHRLIMGGGAVVDHINGDGLDNRRQNLRRCEHKENIRNRRKLAPASSVFKGVRRRTDGSWRAEIVQNGEFLHLGTFRDEARAARQYDRAARLLFGQFALTNEMMGLFAA